MYSRAQHGSQKDLTAHDVTRILKRTPIINVSYLVLYIYVWRLQWPETMNQKCRIMQTYILTPWLLHAVNKQTDRNTHEHMHTPADEHIGRQDWQKADTSRK